MSMFPMKVTYHQRLFTSPDQETELDHIWQTLVLQSIDKGLGAAILDHPQDPKGKALW